jgi:hypothetical protein
MGRGSPSLTFVGRASSRITAGGVSGAGAGGVAGVARAAFLCDRAGGGGGDAASRFAADSRRSRGGSLRFSTMSDYY